MSSVFLTEYYSLGKINWMDELREWLGRQYGPGAKYPSPRQLSLAISNNRNQGIVAEIENKGLVKFETAINLARATETPLVRILLMAGIVDESEIEAMAGQVLSADQAAAAEIAGELPDDFASAWLESGVRLRELVPESDE